MAQPATNAIPASADVNSFIVMVILGLSVHSVAARDDFIAGQCTVNANVQFPGLDGAGPPPLVAALPLWGYWYSRWLLTA
jgi:hypothetical protein